MKSAYNMRYVMFHKICTLVLKEKRKEKEIYMNKSLCSVRMCLFFSIGLHTQSVVGRCIVEVVYIRTQLPIETVSYKFGHCGL